MRKGILCVNRRCVKSVIMTGDSYMVVELNDGSERIFPFSALNCDQIIDAVVMEDGVGSWNSNSIENIRDIHLAVFYEKEKVVRPISLNGEFPEFVDKYDDFVGGAILPNSILRKLS